MASYSPPLCFHFCTLNCFRRVAPPFFFFFVFLYVYEAPIFLFSFFSELLKPLFSFAFFCGGMFFHSSFFNSRSPTLHFLPAFSSTPLSFFWCPCFPPLFYGDILFLLFPLSLHSFFSPPGSLFHQDGLGVGDGFKVPSSLIAPFLP